MSYQEDKIPALFIGCGAALLIVLMFVASDCDNKMRKHKEAMADKGLYWKPGCDNGTWEVIPPAATDDESTD